MYPTFDVLGIRIHALQIPDLQKSVEHWIAQGPLGRTVFFANVHVVMEAVRDGKFCSMIDAADLVVPDGKPLVWLGRKRGFALPRRVYGPEFMHEFCRSTQTKSYSHFFYGGAPGVPEELARTLKEKFPDLKIAGHFSPPFRPLNQEEDDAAVAKIHASGADVLWVGLGAPKQERWIHDHKGKLRVAVMLAVGQAFDLHSGRRRPAPAWMADSGLEWLYRLLREPRRLWRRYLVDNGSFVIALTKYGLHSLWGREIKE